MRVSGSLLKSALRLAISLVLAGLVAALARVPMGKPLEDAFLRLSLRSTTGQVEVCRDRTPEELEQLPVHMRQPRLCDRQVLPYRLTVTVDGERLVDRTVISPGARADRPMVVDESLTLAPGAIALDIVFVPETPTADDDSTLLAEAKAAAPRYRLEQTVELRAGRITLVALDEAAGRFAIYD